MAQPHVILFEHANFCGQHQHIFEDCENVGSEFNDKTSSIVILEGNWAFFADVDGQGQLAQPLGPGLYPWVENCLQANSNDRITSLKLVPITICPN